jgi:DNA-binding MarR family transcriptional regulator
MITFIQETQRGAERDIVGTGISPAQFFLLKVLLVEQYANQANLAAALGVTAGNISQLQTKLERAGLIRRTGQGRAKIATLTGEGRRLVLRLEPRYEAFLRRRFASLSAVELKTLCQLLSKLQQSQPKPGG